MKKNAEKSVKQWCQLQEEQRQKEKKKEKKMSLWGIIDSATRLSIMIILRFFVCAANKYGG